MVQNPIQGKPELSFIWLEITEKCNLTCNHCYADSSPNLNLFGNMEYKDWLTVIDEASSFGCCELQFIGGEPTLYPHLIDLIKYASEKGFSLIEVFTNATMISPKLLGCFKENNVQVATSFYSENPKVHDAITQGKGSWQRTVSGIKTIIEAELPLRVGVIEMENNSGQFHQTANFLKSIGVSQVGFDRQRGVGRSNSVVSIETPSESLSELCGECWKGKLCVTSSGNTYPCVFSRKTLLGNAKNSIGKILESPTLQKFRNQVRHYQEENTIMACLPNSPYPPAPCYPASTPPTPCGPHTCGPGTSPCYPLK